MKKAKKKPTYFCQECRSANTKCYQKRVDELSTHILEDNQLRNSKVVDLIIERSDIDQKIKETIVECTDK